MHSTYGLLIGVRKIIKFIILTKPIISRALVIYAGKLESGFFVGNGAIIFLFGFVVILMSCIGCQGMDNQTMKFGVLCTIYY